MLDQWMGKGRGYSDECIPPILVSEYGYISKWSICHSIRLLYLCFIFVLRYLSHRNEVSTPKVIVDSISSTMKVRLSRSRLLST